MEVAVFQQGKNGEIFITLCGIDGSAVRVRFNSLREFGNFLEVGWGWIAEAFNSSQTGKSVREFIENIQTIDVIGKQ